MLCSLVLLSLLQSCLVVHAHRGCLVRDAELRARTQVLEEVPLADIPDHFDARDQWPHCHTIGEIRDQANCGSCWAISTAEVMSDRTCIASNGKVRPRLSATTVTSCIYHERNGCQGGDPLKAFVYWVNHGVVTGGNYTSQSGCQPYFLPNCDHHTAGHYKPCKGSGSAPPCTQSCKNGISYKSDLHYGEKAYALPENMQKIQSEILRNGPLVMGFDVYEDFEVYRSGVYKHRSGSIKGGHAVRVIGWGTENGDPYWLIANSWNTDWGENGFVKFYRGTNECDIEGDVSGGLARV